MRPEFTPRRNIEVTEAEIFSDLMHFLLRKNNRLMTNEQIIEKTGVSEEMIHQWVKTGKLKPEIFPNLGAPCDRCAEITNFPKLCRKCSQSFTATIEQEKKDRAWFDQIHNPTRKNAYRYR